jgi:hypothetical protein
MKALFFIGFMLLTFSSIAQTSGNIFPNREGKDTTFSDTIPVKLIVVKSDTTIGMIEGIEVRTTTGTLDSSFGNTVCWVENTNYKLLSYTYPADKGYGGYYGFWYSDNYLSVDDWFVVLKIIYSKNKMYRERSNSLYF